jgi:curved DNA-binding protein CbpA
MGTTAENEPSFEVAAQVDITKLPLTAEEGFVLSRILGRRVTAADLQREGVLKGADAAGMIDSLVRKGALLRVGGARAPAAADGGFDGIIFSASDLAEPVDLTEDQRKRILYVEQQLERWSNYRLLGVKRTAPVSDVKAAYFKVSREFHPDAFFRKNLGSYKDRIERIFKAMKGAYDTLSDPERRKKYDDTAVVLELTPEEQVEIDRLADVRKKEHEARERELRNEARMKESRLKRNPLTDRIKRGRDLMRLAEDAFATGKLDEAANQCRLAMTYDDSEATKERARKIILEADRARAQQIVKRVKGVLSSPMDARDLAEEMNRLVDQAADIGVASADGALLADVALLLVALKRPVRAAKLAQQAAELAPKNARAFEALAEGAAADKKWAIAQRAAERWLALEPTAARAKDLVKEAKRNT